MNDSVKQTLLRVGILIVLGLVFLAGATIVEQIQYNSTNHPKRVSFINYGETPVRVEIEGEATELAEEELFLHTSETEGEIAYAIYNEADEVIREGSYTTDNKPFAAIEIVGNETDKCLVTTEVANFYYQFNFDEDRTVGEFAVKTSDDTPAQSFILPEDYIAVATHDLAIIPGEFSGDRLPDELDEDEIANVTATYPTDCENLAGEEPAVDALRSDFLSL